MDDGWGGTGAFKTKGSWEFVWRTLSCKTPVDYLAIPNIGYPNSHSHVPKSGSEVLIQGIFRGWAVHRPIPSLAVLSANQVNGHRRIP